MRVTHYQDGAIHAVHITDDPKLTVYTIDDTPVWTVDLATGVTRYRALGARLTWRLEQFVSLLTANYRTTNEH